MLEYKNKISVALNENKYNVVRNILLEFNERDISEILEFIAEEFGEEKLLLIFRMLPNDIAAEAFADLSNEQQQSIVETISDKEIGEIINNLYLDDTVDFLEEMPAYIVQRVLKNVNPAKRKQVNQILKYPEKSAGSIMTTEYLELKKDMTVKEALEYIKEEGINKKTIVNCYVVNEKNLLEGTVSIRKVIITNEKVKIEDIMKTVIISVSTFDDQEEVAKIFKKYDLNTLPVIDKRGNLVGIITVDDVIDVIVEETTEDIERMNALLPSEDEYLKTNIAVLAKNRIVWLFVLMISAIISGNIMRGYESMLEAIVVLSAFIPMLMGTAGNAGAQSSVLIIRGMSLGEIEIKDIFKVIKKEIGIGIFVGVILSIINFVKVGIIDTVGIQVGIVVSISLFLTLILANVIGCILPMVAQKIKVDPAIMASPLVTTIIDAGSLLIYFYTAQIILGI